MIDARHDQAPPVTASDRVSDVLARNVMARLVTVDQAARTANVSADRLVSELNAALGISAESPVSTPPEQSRIDVEETLVHPASAKVIEVDVRDDLRSGREPFSRIMSAVASLPEGNVLHLRAIFEPVPLFTVLGKRGFAHESQSHEADDWSVWFWRPDTSDAVAVQASAAPVFDSDVPADDATTTYLDVRGFSPPEPMMRTLVALETLPAGHTLVQINARVPQFLFPVLVERGFAWEIDDVQTDRVVVRIRHAQ
jgi:uncharacterized protein (DUF2249 family)